MEVQLRIRSHKYSIFIYYDTRARARAHTSALYVQGHNRCNSEQRVWFYVVHREMPEKPFSHKKNTRVRAEYCKCVRFFFFLSRKILIIDLLFEYVNNIFLVELKNFLAAHLPIPPPPPPPPAVAMYGFYYYF